MSGTGARDGGAAGDHADLAALIRDVPDFPEPGIIYKDITPLLADGAALTKAARGLADPYLGQVDMVVGIEARGFILAPMVALRLGVGFVPLRKAGRLPHTTVSRSYDLEYGSASIEVHADAFANTGGRALIVDDVLATGGTAAAAIDLVEAVGGTVVGLAFLIELSFLAGAGRLGGLPCTSLITY